jgi:hypothetical protein
MGTNIAAPIVDVAMQFMLVMLQLKLTPLAGSTERLWCGSIICTVSSRDEDEVGEARDLGRGANFKIKVGLHLHSA